MLTVNDAVTFNSTALVSGNGQLTIAGLGSLTLTDMNNTFSGGLVLNAGGLGATGTLIVASSTGTTLGALTSGALELAP